MDKITRCGSCGDRELDYDQELINKLADDGCLCMIALRRRLKDKGVWLLDQD